MKNCRTLNGLLKSIENNEGCQLKYTHKSLCHPGDKWIIYQANGTNLIISNVTHEKIKNYLVKA